MHVITRGCVLFLWMHMLTFVKGQDCTLQQFLNGPLFDSNFDTTDLRDSYPGGKQVRVSCNVGYSGFFKLQCIEGKWQSVGSKCQPRSCGHPGDAPFADFHLDKGDDFVFGSQVVYTCHKGYQMVSRKNYRRCMAEGWDGVVPVCESHNCPVFTVNDNVLVFGDLEEATFGNIVRFDCKYKEILNGLQELYCDENGKWSGDPPTCQAIKCLVPEIENGYVPGDIQDYREDDILHFRCNPLYQPAETRSSQCTKQGVKAIWSPTPMCEPITCRLILPPVRGTRYEPASRNVFSPGDTVRVICGAKYWISTPQDTSAVLTCKEDGEWNVDPTCQEVKCTSRQPEEVHSWQVDWRYPKKLGDTTSYWCKTGYKRTGGVSRATCTRDGWKPDPLCEEIKCKSHPDYDIVGYDQNIYGYNDQVEYICKTGYEGRFILTCTEQGWFGSPQCRERQCKKLHIYNAQILRNEMSYYGHNEKVQYTCSNDGNKSFTITCEKGDWTGIQTCSACPNADVPHGFAVGPYNGTLYYTCNEGYKLFTKGWWAKAKCNDGAWSKIESCIANSMCGEIPVIPNGEVTPPRGQSHTARITCNKGYEAQISRLTCLEGEWSADGLSPEQICTTTAVSCSPPPKVENAVVVTSYQKEYESGSAITYRCRNKYTLLQAEDSILCNDGKWEVKNFECKPYCDKLDNRTMTFTADRERYVEGDVIQYHCVTADVDGTATCVNTKWNMSAKCEAPTVPR